ncbi:hypothetical protein BH09SUM1_BH09SUM1_26850 [soil metagenome]
MRYTVAVHRGDAGQVAFGAEVVELPGCFTAAESLDELSANLYDAVALYREGEESKYPEASGFLLQIEISANADHESVANA